MSEPAPVRAPARVAEPAERRSEAVTQEWSGVSPSRPPSLGADERRQEARREARRRLRLIRRRRLDLLQDSALGLLLALFTLVETAGLGVVALLGVLTGLMLVISLVVERRLRRRPAPGRR